MQKVSVDFYLLTAFFKSINQPVSKSINQPISKSTNQAISKSTNNV